MILNLLYTLVRIPTVMAKPPSPPLNRAISRRSGVSRGEEAAVRRSGAGHVKDAIHRLRVERTAPGPAKRRLQVLQA